MQQRFRWTSPRATALLILRAWLGEPAHAPATPALGLSHFQQNAVQRLRAALDRRRGAILADSVGLGKTFVALALIRAALDARERVLVIAPASLRTHWRKHLAKLGTHDVAFTTHTALSRGRLPADEAALIVIDEAHAFRNPGARRYRNLQRIVKNARVLLVSATPINNSAEDLYHLIRVFARDDAFRDLGVADLNRAFRQQSRSELDRVLKEVLVRRGRAQARTDPSIVFPQRAAPKAERYDADWPNALYDALDELAFAPYALESPAPAELMRLHLLKRLESSVAAFRASVRGLRGITEAFLAGATRARARTAAADDDWIQLQLPIVCADAEWARRSSLLRPQALRDAELLRVCERAIPVGPDAKLAQLVALLERECVGEKVLVFTQYADTARYLWKQLRTGRRVGLITGNDARLGANRAARSTVIECFAPQANGVRTSLPDRLLLDLLIATDVLSEGLNLQDASVVVNYEISWNPVTLMQRIGRIDRLGSPHPRIRVYNFVPDRGLDRLLRLMERVETKLATIERLVGADAPVLDAAVGSARRAIEQSLQLRCDAEIGEFTAVNELEALRAELRGEHARLVQLEVPLAATVLGETDSTLVALLWRGALRLLLCEGTQVRENIVETTALLRRALQDDRESESGSLDVSAAVAWLQAQDRSRALRSPGMSVHQRAAAHRLLRITRELPAGSPLVRVAERLLHALALPLAPDVEAFLPGWIAFDGDSSVQLRQLEALLGSQREVAPKELAGPRVLAVLHVRKSV